MLIFQKPLSVLPLTN